VRLFEIDGECAPERSQREKEEAEKNLDQFTRLKRNLAADIEQFKKDAIEMNSNLSKETRDKVGSKNAKLRIQLEDIKKKAGQLEKIYLDKKKKLKGKRIEGKISKEKAQKILLQKEVVSLLKKHLKECEDLLNRGDAKGLYQEDESSSSSSAKKGEFKEKEVSYLPQIDDPQFDIINQQNREIDEGLDIFYNNVLEFKKIQQSIGFELKEQDTLLIKLQERAEGAQDDLAGVNRRLNDTIKKVRSAKNLCCDIFLFLVVLGIIGAVYLLIVNGGK